ncbi:tetratricopeptide repeat protein [Dysgonomonas sp. GY75]|uniref:tetratricopeptide repeat-containing sensor histidine kinase n=1 Tax=Dysgonomonas sp. GY75 TaxID=2780419 RepID=UPI0018841682|nr:tetratricopeptide repeat-containing sensor histidine kinase [Dysgonomonas sp. GY75]MBF0651480.1 tetratricopeptide repeat protein [Dysgonomonas sp. GY75]
MRNCLFILFLILQFSCSSEIKNETVKDKEHNEEVSIANEWNDQAQRYYEEEGPNSANYRKAALLAYEKAIEQNDDLQIGFALMYLGELAAIDEGNTGRIKKSQEAIKYFEKINATEYIAQGYDNIGLSYSMIGKYEDAILNHKKALEILESAEYEDESRLWYFMFNLALAYSGKGDAETALFYYKEVEKLASLNNDLEILYETYNSFGAIFDKTGKYQESIKYYEKALTYYEKEKDINRACHLLLNLSVLYSERNKIEQALFLSRKAMKLISEYPNEIYYADRAYREHGSFLINAGLYQNALDTLYLANAHTKNDNEEQIYLNHIALADVHSELNNLDSCSFYLREAEKLLNKNEELPSIRYHLMAESHLFHLKDFEKSIFHSEAFLNVDDSLHRIGKINTLKVLNHLSESYKEGRSDYKNAFKYKEKAYVLRDSLYKQEHSNAIDEFYTKYETAQKDLEISRLNEEKQKERFQRTLIISISSFIIILLFIAFLYNRIKRLNKEKEALLLAHQIEQKEQEYQSLLKDSEQKLTEQYIAGLESERTRLAKDLHDGIANDLLAVCMHLENNLDHTSAKKQLHDAYNNIRNISHNLNPPIMADVTFVDIMQSFVRKYNTLSDIKLHLNIATDEEWNDLPSVYAIASYRIIQEAVSNSIKHAKTENISIDVIYTGQNLSVNILDDGVGFNPQKIKKGLGLKDMEDRARVMQGSFEIHSVINQGTKVCFTFNIPSYL